MKALDAGADLFVPGSMNVKPRLSVVEQVGDIILNSLGSIRVEIESVA